MSLITIDEGLELEQSWDAAMPANDAGGETIPLLTRVARREPEAFNQCIEQYGNLVWSIARRFSPGQLDAEDAVQEIFLELWQKAERFDPSLSAETTFVTMIARRRLIDRYRKQSKSIESTSFGVEMDDLLPADTGASYDVVDEAAKATRCLDSLQSNPREILRKSIHEGRSHSQISLDMSIPLGSVKSFARRGLIQLRECMERFSIATKTGVA
jgi:RNA polymerase sigma-70 factor (ECF subfamily)